MLYYFLLSALPPLSLQTEPEMTFLELKDFLSLNLNTADWKKFQVLLRPIDLYNIRALWLGQPLDERGVLNEKELEEALLVRDFLPAYFIDFLDRYETTEERLNAFPSLYAMLFRETDAPLKGFLHRYHVFERERMLILTALRAKLTGKDLVRELQFEDPNDPFIAYLLSQKDAAEFTAPKEYEDLKVIFVKNVHNPEELNRAILEYRLRKIEDMEEEEPPFSIGRVLGYAARFLIVENWFRLDWEKGKLEVEKLRKYEG
ncbi:MAG TPA: DUF2764 family protein [Chlamydiales bacterium]|nr:DUF2764 family protein [Chlamydiales bacterium]